MLDASGDLAGLGVQVQPKLVGRPSAEDIGLDAVASLPEVTSVGGTTLFTDPPGVGSPNAPGSTPLSQGSGGVSQRCSIVRPWQQVEPPGGAAARRLTPDVSAVADQFTGLKIVLDQEFALGGGTFAGRPGLGRVHGADERTPGAQRRHLIGHLNPLLYRIAAGAPRPAFQDITEGGSAVAPPVRVTTL